VVYVIGSPDFRYVKIGTTTKIDRRLVSLQGGCPVPLCVMWKTAGGRDLEQKLHSILRRFRTRGEWFDFGDRDAVEIVEREVVRAGHLQWPLPARSTPKRLVRATPPPKMRTQAKVISAAACVTPPARPAVTASVLAHLAQAPSPETTTALADALRLNKSSVSTVLNRLANRGAVARIGPGLWAVAGPSNGGSP
jgi:hypothetical protein